MKMRELVKVSLLTLVTMAFLVSCGKENKSSGGSSSNSSNYGYPTGGSYGNGSMSLPSNWIDILRNENPCTDYNTGNITNNRTRIVVTLDGLNVNANSMYAGITGEGDIGIVSVKNNRPVIEIFACNRPNLGSNARGYIVSQYGTAPVLNVSQNCSVSEISSMDIGLETNQSGYILRFYPIYLDSRNKPQYGSRLCQY